MSGRYNSDDAPKFGLAAGRSMIIKSESPSDSESISKRNIFANNMPTLNSILKELRNVPVGRLEDLYSIIHSLRADIKKTDKGSKKILSFAGSFGDMAEKDYQDFLQDTKHIRNTMFDRDVNF